MKLESRKASKVTRRGMAFFMAAAVGASMLVSAPRADAVASKRKPLIGAKKKTLYYNKAGKKKYTLKIKKNKVRKITSTTWKSSRKSVVAISSKKKMSVKLTAKKKGTSVITATVKYIPKGGWWHRTVKLKCKVKSKRAASGADLVKTPKPTQTKQPADGKAATIVLNRTNVLLSKADDNNTISLTATVQDAKGNPLEDEDVEWKTDNAAVATVDDDGLVKALSDGTAHITASMDGIVSSPCTVTVDAVSPTIERAVVTGSKTVTVYFSESVKGNPVVSVRQNTSNESTYMDAVLAKNGKSLLVTSTQEFSTGTYLLTIEGLTDQAGNELKYNQVTVTKNPVIISGFLCKTEQVPAGQSKVLVYYTLLDQYGEEHEFMSIEDLQVTAATESGMPLDAKLKDDGKKGWIEISGAVGALAPGRKIQITLRSEKLALDGTISTALVDPQGVGEATRISGAVISGMENEGTESAPILTLGSGEADNVFSLSAKLLDKFGIPVEKAQVIYVIEDTGVLAFEDTKEPNTAKVNTSDDAVKVKALKGGETTITAYLASDDMVRLPIKIKIKATRLSEIKVASPLDAGINGRETELETALNPAGTGLTLADLTYRVEEGEDAYEKIEFVEESGKFYTKITAKTNSENNTIKFCVVYDNKTPDDLTDDIVSNAVTYQSVPLTNSVTEIEIDPFEENEVTAGATATTDYRLLNRYKENITKKWKGEKPKVVVKDPSVIKRATVNADGQLEVVAGNQGETDVTLSIGNATAVLGIKVAAVAHVNKIVPKDVRGQLKLNRKGVSGEKTYIEIDHVEDQYGNKSYKLTEKEFKELSVKVGEEEATSLTAGIFEITPCKKNSAGEYVALLNTDSVEAICVKWGSDTSSVPESGSDCVLDFLYKGVSVMGENKYTIEIQEARELRVLTIANTEKGKVVASGAKVSDTISVSDQYGEELENTGITIIVEVIDAEGTIIRAEELEGDGSKKWEVPLTMNMSGNYTVRAYVKSNEKTTYQTATVKSEYSLRVDKPENLIKEIIVSNWMTKDQALKLDLDVMEKSEIDYIYVRPAGSAELAFDYVAKDADGNEITLPEGTNIVWSVTSNGGITAEKKAANSDTFVIQGDKEGTEGTVEVTASYFIGEKRIDSEPRIVKVKCEKAIPQKASYEIHLLDENGVEEVNKDYKENGFYEFSSATPSGTCNFVVTARDQNGAPCQAGDIQLDAVTATDENKASATIDETSANQFTVSMKQWGEVKINVFLPDKISYQFTVAEKPDVLTAGLHDQKNEIPSSELYNQDSYSVTTELDRASSTDEFTVLRVKIECQDLKKHWNNANPKEQGYWTGILVPMEEARCCVQDDKSAFEIINDITSGTENLKEFNQNSQPDYVANGNRYWAFYYDEGKSKQGYAVMKKADHYIIYLIDLSGVEEAQETE